MWKHLSCVLPCIFAFIAIIARISIVNANSIITEHDLDSSAEFSNKSAQLKSPGKYNPEDVDNSIQLNTILGHREISDDWRVFPLFGKVDTRSASPMFISDFPVAPGKTVKNYFKARDFTVQIDTIIISQVSPKTGKLGRVLDSWIAKGLSSHYILSREKTKLVRWSLPKLGKGQMAGPPWNARSILILAETDSSQRLNRAQINVLKDLLAITKSAVYNEDIKYLMDYKEARGSGNEGVIANIEDMRQELCLSINPDAPQ